MHHRVIGQIMNRDVVTVEADTPVKQAAALLARNGISGLPVVDDDDRVLGVLSKTDLTLRQAAQGTEPPSWWQTRLAPGARRERIARQKAGARTAGELMTSPAITVHARQSIAEAARVMAAGGVERLPVIDEEGRLAGIVSRSDLLRVFLRPDGEIRDEVVQEVLVRTLWLPPDSLRVEVDDGVVTLNGTVSRRSEAGIAVRLTGRVDGVVSVVDELAWEEDDSGLPPGERAMHGIAEEWLRRR
ncbi:CBS domain-containing protein [Streptomyces aidingensis]|uniref:BON domain-containing protein n=1 Tax=Streptomyces aidingensis TaxID=910347 RepID=A0A1I1J3Y8_9ACTN|nr:CBS domain-containing protein [Streptomyces aidingensis]SFC43277.1 BON domain-containing protein [Streptomyces aidingensis]